MFWIMKLLQILILLLIIQQELILPIYLFMIYSIKDMKILNIMCLTISLMKNIFLNSIPKAKISQYIVILLSKRTVLGLQIFLLGHM